MKKIVKKSFWLAIIVLLLMNTWALWSQDYNKNREPIWGVTFSHRYATELGLDWQEVYLAILNDLKIKQIRIPVYWSEIEKEPDKYDFSIVDWQIVKAAEMGVKVVLVVGYRVPRWPECFAPSWTSELNSEQFNNRIELLLTESINHFKGYNNIIAWQVHNEPFLESFGNCRPLSETSVADHVGIVKNIDNKRPIILTESGELSTWIKSAHHADVVGTSLYRTVWNKYMGYWRYPLPPAFYYLHAKWIVKNYPVSTVVISELQAEPWPPGKHIMVTSLDDQFKSFDFEKLEHNIDYARRTGIAEVYLWGVEWWYWLKSQGHPEFWQYIKNLK